MYSLKESYAIRTPVQWPKPVRAISSPHAILDLITRVLDNAPSAKLFQVTIAPDLAFNTKDVFEIMNGSTTGSILITASSGVAAAWGFNYYLKYVTNSSGTKLFLHITLSLSLFLPIHFYHLCSLLVWKKYPSCACIEPELLGFGACLVKADIIARSLSTPADPRYDTAYSSANSISCETCSLLYSQLGSDCIEIETL